MSGKAKDQEHPGVEALEKLHAGRLDYEQTVSLNRHRRMCPECRLEYDRIAMTADRPATQDPGFAERAREIMNRHRRLAAEELAIRLPEPVMTRETDLDRIMKGLGSFESSRFLLTPGKLDTVLDEIKDRVKKLEDDPTLTPEGEKSFIAFLARCVEENAKSISGERDEMEFDLFAKMFDSLEEIVKEKNMGLEDRRLLENAREAFQEKIASLTGKFKKQAGGA